MCRAQEEKAKQSRLEERAQVAFHSSPAAAVCEYANMQIQGGHPTLIQCASWLTGDLTVQKRAEVRARLDLDRYMTSSDSEAPNEEVQNEEADVKVITNNGVSSVVTVAPFSINTDR